MFFVPELVFHCADNFCEELEKEEKDVHNDTDTGLESSQSFVEVQNVARQYSRRGAES